MTACGQRPGLNSLTESWRDLLVQLAQVGLDPDNPDVNDFVNALVQPDALPSLQELAMLEIKTNLRTEEMMQHVDEHS